MWSVILCERLGPAVHAMYMMSDETHHIVYPFALCVVCMPHACMHACTLMGACLLGARLSQRHRPRHLRQETHDNTSCPPWTPCKAMCPCAGVQAPVGSAPVEVTTYIPSTTSNQCIGTYVLAALQRIHMWRPAGNYTDTSEDA